MQPHEERVVAERADLELKIDRLRSFIRDSRFERVSRFNRFLLLSQLEVMSSYATILTERIRLFSQPAAPPED